MVLSIVLLPSSSSSEAALLRAGRLRRDGGRLAADAAQAAAGAGRALAEAPAGATAGGQGGAHGGDARVSPAFTLLFSGFQGFFPKFWMVLPGFT